MIGPFSSIASFGGGLAGHSGSVAADVIAVAAGGAAGALVRWTLTIIAASMASFDSAGGLPIAGPPLGTTVANVLGCALMGWFVILAGTDLAASDAWHHTPRVQLAIRVGMIGALTTFSTFVAESVAMGQSGRPGSLAVYVLANVVLGTAAFLIVQHWARSGAV